MKEWNRRKAEPKPCLKMRKVRDNATLPTREEDGPQVGLYSAEDMILWPGDIRIVHTGVAMVIPDGCIGLVLTRSSMGASGVRLSGGADFIRPGCKEEACVILRNDGVNPWAIGKGDKVANLILVPCVDAVLEEEG